MSYTKLLYHIVFRTHASRPVIAEADERSLYNYIFGICQHHRVKLFRIGGMPNHLHLFVGLPPTLTVADFVKIVKVAAHNYMKSEPALFPLFEGWAKSYCALTYCMAEKDAVIRYIASQKEHHAKLSLQDEVKQLMELNGIDRNEKYWQQDWVE